MIVDTDLSLISFSGSLAEIILLPMFLIAMQCWDSISDITDLFPYDWV